MAEKLPQDKEGSGQLVKPVNKLASQKNDVILQSADVLKLLIAVLLIACGIWVFYTMQNIPAYLRALFPVVGVILGLLIVFYWCHFGRRLVGYVRDSVAEFKKVVWPLKNDAIRMTIFVVIFVTILSVFIYATDSLISWLFFDLLLKRG
ncbi:MULTISPECIES: preprotein translocase subunit SecE [unclassified Neisseria]|uniref:preprotein translocase subunit SecE n=1 Tax=unclassified Neisseria TaxID=2623750 RepID=UPI0026658EAE|nr:MULTISPECIES: preprotein translocase subunit SecE [unclassified Neisseria]MDO1511013.1 preprotein translocase subunit SecE [Neisseria sp. MVDL19-042950]MDO1517272.1 preprotein translocase subunit SecE [Neisseria sp. MVDL18-041461]MDO1564635.1 preprotein translocase subunit SecE [Neisseria sp. MVDL20-010259]